MLGEGLESSTFCIEGRGATNCANQATSVIKHYYCHFTSIYHVYNDHELIEHIIMANSISNKTQQFDNGID
uniref:Uncharacterized protein n=1 Tax=Romanomermis culicivorax TaxID=13658 RepID=A0A915L8I4_ROMCU